MTAKSTERKETFPLRGQTALDTGQVHAGMGSRVTAPSRAQLAGVGLHRTHLPSPSRRFRKVVLSYRYECREVTVFWPRPISSRQMSPVATTSVSDLCELRGLLLKSPRCVLAECESRFSLSRPVLQSNDSPRGTRGPGFGRRNVGPSSSISAPRAGPPGTCGGECPVCGSHSPHAGGDSSHVGRSRRLHRRAATQGDHL